MLTELFESGIETENSDIRAHVGPMSRAIYVFKTADCRALIKARKFPVKSAGQYGVIGPTAEGWIVPKDEIPNIRKIEPHSWPRWAEFSTSWTTSQKGKWAVDCVSFCLMMGRFPIWIDAAGEDDRKCVQIKGTDIILFCKKKIQVKCDAPEFATGNLYIQKAERNPLKRY
jgi:hypothetical protein